jgi:hypothetical protein
MVWDHLIGIQDSLAIWMDLQFCGKMHNAWPIKRKIKILRAKGSDYPDHNIDKIHVMFERSIFHFLSVGQFFKASPTLRQQKHICK